MPYIEAFTDTKVVNTMMVMAKGKLAFDIGANGGYVAKLLSRAFDKVVAVEPCEESYSHLVPRCPIPNLTCLNIAASDHIGTVTLGVKSWTETHGELFTGDSLQVWGPDTDTRTVECTTLDTLAAWYGYPDFVKIDTEGHEALIVDGAHEVFSHHPSFIIEIHDKANGDYIASYFDSIDLHYVIHYHQVYADDDPDRPNHYWMVGE